VYGHVLQVQPRGGAGKVQPVVETPLLVIGAGPYGLSTAAFAQDHGLPTLIVGHPMEFWREHMPEEMFLRSGGEWFRDMKRVAVREELVTELARANGGFEAKLSGGDRITADAVVCAPGIRHYTNLPGWAASVSNGLAAHTCDLVCFDELAGARVLIVGGRQSAYEWAALIGEHGAERIHVVHRHAVPRFERVSWKFVDTHVARTTAVRGYWRTCHRQRRTESSVGSGRSAGSRSSLGSRRAYTRTSSTAGRGPR
jgi:thioredoxin reductase